MNLKIWGRGSVGFFFTTLVLFVTASNAIWHASASAQVVLLADTYAEPNLQESAKVSTMMLRQTLSAPHLTIIAGSDLVTAGASAEFGRVTIPLDALPAIAKATTASYAVLSELAAEGAQVRLEVHLLDAEGNLLTSATQSGDTSHLQTLVHDAAKQLQGQLGQVQAIPLANPATWMGYYDAETKLIAKDANGAALALMTTDRSLSSSAPMFRKLAEKAWNTPNLDGEQRTALVGRYGTPAQIETLVTGDSDNAKLARARAQLSLANPQGALKELETMTAGSQEKWIVIAEIASFQADKPARDKAVRELLKLGSAGGLTYIASLPPGALDAGLEKELTAVASKSTNPAIATAMAMRAIASGVAGAELESALAAVQIDYVRPNDIAVLRSAVAKAAEAGQPAALRVRAELEWRFGDPTKAESDLTLARKGGETPRMLLLQASLYEQKGSLQAAADAFGRAGDKYNQARVLDRMGNREAAYAAIGENAPPSLLRSRLKAKQPGAQAVAELEKGNRLYPLNMGFTRELSTAQKASGNAAGAAKTEARLGKLESFSPAFKNRKPSETKSDKAPGAAQAQKFANDTELQTWVAFLGENGARQLQGRQLVIGWLDPTPFYQPRIVDRARVTQMVTKALKSGFNIRLVPGDQDFNPQSDALEDIESYATDNNADGAILIGLSKGKNGVVAKAFLIDAKTHADNSGIAVAATLPNNDYWQWNYTCIALLTLAILVVLGTILYFVIRGTSHISVRVKLDPAGTDEALRVLVSKSPTRPALTDPLAFRSELKKGGHRRRLLRVDLAGPISEFRVAPGEWTVHVIGVWDRDTNFATTRDFHSQTVTLKRGQAANLQFELAAQAAEVRVKVSGVSQQTSAKPNASVGVAIWLEGREDKKQFLQQDGEVVLHVPVGSYTLVLLDGETKLTRPLPISTLAIHRVAVNLDRERKLAEVSGGLSLGQRAPEPAPMFADEASDNAPPKKLGHDPAMPPPQTPAGTAPKAPPLGASGISINLPPDLAFAAGSNVSAEATARTMGISDPKDSALGNMATPLGQKLLGRYKLSKELGRGAMGVVYQGWDENLERDVAIKVLSPELRQHPQALAFFQQEAKSLAQMNHTNVVSVYDQTTSGQETMLIMEFVDGMTLEYYLQQATRLAPDQAISVISQLCDGLAYAHSKRVIHRDIKPANIFVSREGIIKLGDFGLARVVHEIAIRKTEVRGTPLYMAPEQVLGTDIDSRADIYAVGCTLYEALTGQPPFPDGQVMYHHVHTPVTAPSVLRPELSPGIDQVVLGCLAKKPSDRIATAQDLKAMLGQLL